MPRSFWCVLLAAAVAAPLVSARGATPGRTSQEAARQDESPATWPKPDRFWYRRAMQGGNVWILVDARHGVREPLFDHQRLATELNLKSGSEFGPLTLPFADPAARFVMKYDGSNAYVQEGARAVEFVLYDFVWRCDLDNKWDWNKIPPTDYGCQTRRPVGPDDRGPLPAPPVTVPAADGRWQAFVSEHNVAVRRGDGDSVRVLSTDGTAEFPYEAGSIEWSEDGRSVAAYRVHRDVFQSPGLTGRVSDQVVRGEWAVDGSGGL